MPLLSCALRNEGPNFVGGVTIGSHHPVHRFGGKGKALRRDNKRRIPATVEHLLQHLAQGIGFGSGLRNLDYVSGTGPDHGSQSLGIAAYRDQHHIGIVV